MIQLIVTNFSREKLPSPQGGKSLDFLFGQGNREAKIMREHAPGVDMMAQAEIVELKGKVRDYEKEIKEYERKTEKQEKEIERLKNITGKSYGIGTVWFVAIVSFLIGIGATTAFFLLT